MQQTLRKLIADGKTKQAIAELRKLSFADNEVNNQIIQLAASFSTYEKQLLANEEDPSVLRRELQRINKALLVLIDGLEENGTSAASDGVTQSHAVTNAVTKPNPSKMLVIGAFIVAAIAVLANLATILDFLGFKEKQQKVEKPVVEPPKHDTIIVQPKPSPPKVAPKVPQTAAPKNHFE